MRKQRSVLLRIFAAGFLFFASGCAGSRSAELIGQPAPQTRVQLLDGDPVLLSQFVGHGKPVVLTFWASTCMYSPRALETLNKMAVTLKPQGVEFLAVSIDKDEHAADVRDIIKYRELGNMTHAFSGNDVYDEAYISFKGDELPYVVVIDGQGKVAAAGNKPSVVREYFKIS